MVERPRFVQRSSDPSRTTVIIGISSPPICVPTPPTLFRPGTLDSLIYPRGIGFLRKKKVPWIFATFSSRTLFCLLKSTALFQTQGASSKKQGAAPVWGGWGMHLHRGDVNGGVDIITPAVLLCTLVPRIPVLFSPTGNGTDNSTPA